MIDAYTKAVLTVIALSLAVIAVNLWVAPQHAQTSKHENVVTAIFAAVSQIANGDCKNPKICEAS